jgi:hypothetical protein
VKVINNTKIPEHVINAMLNDLGISEARYTLTIELGDCNGRGLCRRSGRSFLVVLSYADHEVLAHELKHVEQHVSGLSDYMRLERELTPYKERWHEVEAREYSKRYA